MKIIVRLSVYFVFNFFLYTSLECIKRDKCVFDGRPFGCDQTEVREIDYWETAYHRCISVLKDKAGKKFIVKQDMRDALYWHLSIARDKLGALVAQSGDILANRVEIIPAYCEFPGKRNMKLPASLHAFVPGVSVKSLAEDFWVFIQQRSRVGLTLEIVKYMSRHEDLCKIVALDTFIANTDRHKSNFFYDRRSDHYYAIDLERSFSHNIATHACKLIKSILNGQVKVSKKELHALKIYRDVIKNLLHLHTPESLHAHLVEFAMEEEILSRTLRSTVLDRLKLHQETIAENYHSCKKLIVLLDKLLIHHG